MAFKYFSACIFLVILQTCFAPPVTQNKKENQDQPESEYGGLEDYMEYHRYLKEVVNALEADPEFRQKLEKADENDIKSGKIAEELHFVSHHVRTRLDEIKRVELQRLKELVEKKRKLEQETNSIDEDPVHHHLDQNNPHTFEIDDLKKLIAKTTEDLAEADKKRKEEFKTYEMEKEYLKEEKLNHTTGEEREKLEKEFKEMEEKHKKHEKLHQPGHKAQLEEVWEEQDQMQQDFDPKTFFMLHDIDGNGLWDQEEVKALFIKELDKMYQAGAPEDDMRERLEEMERMRETVFREMDINRDGFIDYTEFLQQTNTNDFKQDNGWQGLDEQTRPYTDEELAAYIRAQHGANQYPQGYAQVPPGAYQQPVQYNQQQYYSGAPQQMVQHQNTNNQPQYQPPQAAINQQNVGGNVNYQQPNLNNQQQYQPPQAASNQQNIGGNGNYQPQNMNNQQQYQQANVAYNQQLPPQQQQNNVNQGYVPQQQGDVNHQQLNVPQHVDTGNLPQQGQIINNQQAMGGQPNVQLNKI